MHMNTDLLGKVAPLGVALLLTVPALQGCKTDPPTDEAGTETAGDGDGDPGDGDGDPGDGDGDQTGDGDGDQTGDGDGDQTGDGDGDQTGDGDGDPAECPTFDPIAGAADGEACSANGSCSSQLCELFQDVPPVEGTCQPADDMCRTRIMGTMLDFSTRMPLPDINMKVATAIMAAVDPVGATSQADATSDANGIIDTLSTGPLASPLGIVGLSSGDGYYLTATGLASPADGMQSYGPANAIHDIWAVPAADLTAWSDALMGDPEMMEFLPLGDEGGVVGLVRDATTGDLIEGAVVVSVDPDTTSAKIRYLNAAGDGFTSDMTSTQGMFVIVDPGLGEDFDVEIDGMSQGLSGTAGSANGAIFTLIMNVGG
jgi:hypothetical protein